MICTTLYHLERECPMPRFALMTNHFVVWLSLWRTWLTKQYSLLVCLFSTYYWYTVVKFEVFSRETTPKMEALLDNLGHNHSASVYLTEISKSFFSALITFSCPWWGRSEVDDSCIFNLHSPNDISTHWKSCQYVLVILASYYETKPILNTFAISWLDQMLYECKK